MPEEIRDTIAQTAEHITDAVEHGDLHPRPLVELISLAKAVKDFRKAVEEERGDHLLYWEVAIKHSDNLKKLGL